jgi:hypothetical protein
MNKKSLNSALFACVPVSELWDHLLSDTSLSIKQLFNAMFSSVLSPFFLVSGLAKIDFSAWLGKA